MIWIEWIFLVVFVFIATLSLVDLDSEVAELISERKRYKRILAAKDRIIELNRKNNC